MVAIVDVGREKIIGCKKGSLIWWHKRGHIEFTKSEHGIRHHYWQNNIFHYSYLILILSILLKPVIMFALGFYLVYIAMDLYEERWAWDYAKKNYKKLNSLKNRSGKDEK